ncbi:MAG: alpha/beta hydrolase [Polyangiaceae bacterium]|nr:alpha/beta hydrolase [Polyangiaceae bacterium]
MVRLGDGAELPAFAWPAPEGAPTLVYYHGNGEQLADLVPIGEAFHEAGLGFFTAEYPGYALARAAGGPTEARLYEGAEAALGHLQGALGVPIERTVLVGHSLGSGVATEMAARGRGGSLVLLSPFTSIGDMAAHLVPWLPGRLLVRDPFDSLSKAPRVIVPALVVHGVNDALIPAAMGQRLGAALVQGRVELVPGAGHNDLFSMYGEALVPLIAGFARGGGR